MEGDALEGHLKVSRDIIICIRTLGLDGCFFLTINALEKDNEKLRVINHLCKVRCET